MRGDVIVETNFPWPHARLGDEITTLLTCRQQLAKHAARSADVISVRDREPSVAVGHFGAINDFHARYRYTRVSRSERAFEPTAVDVSRGVGDCDQTCGSTLRKLRG